MTSLVTVEQPAYLKSILHAARYPSCPILGLLLGRVSPTKPHPITIVDALPLFHHHPVGPLLEVALLQAEAFARAYSGGGVALVGVYTACAVYEKKEVSSVAQKVANKIADYGAGSVLMIVSSSLHRHRHRHRPRWCSSMDVCGEGGQPETCPMCGDRAVCVRVAGQRQGRPCSISSGCL